MGVGADPVVSVRSVLGSAWEACPTAGARPSSAVSPSKDEDRYRVRNETGVSRTRRPAPGFGVVNRRCARGEGRREQAVPRKDRH